MPFVFLPDAMAARHAPINADLHVFGSAGDGDDSILGGHDDAELAKRSIASITTMAAAPELVTVALLPIAVRIAAVGGLAGGGHLDPGSRDQELAIKAVHGVDLLTGGVDKVEDGRGTNSPARWIHRPDTGCFPGWPNAPG
jgi:hypothetical protein